MLDIVVRGDAIYKCINKKEEKIVSSDEFFEYAKNITEEEKNRLFALYKDKDDSFQKSYLPSIPNESDKFEVMQLESVISSVKNLLIN